MFYKPQARNDGVIEFRFQILSEDFIEDYSVWDNTKRIFWRGQQVMPASDGQGYATDDTKFMPGEKFRVLFPSCAKKTQYVTEIVVDGTQYSFGFTRSAMDQLKIAIQSARNLGVNPLEINYVLRRTGQKLETTYAIIAGERVGLPQVRTAEAERQQASMPIAQGNPVPPFSQNGFKPQEKPILAHVPPSSSNAPTQPQTSKFGAFTPSTAQNGTGFSNVWKNAGRQDYIQLDPDESAILEEAERATEKLSETDFVNGFCTLMQQRGKQITTPYVQRVVQIHRQLYTGSR